MKKEKLIEKVVRQAIKGLTICVILMLIVTVLIINKGNQEIRLLEKKLGVNQEFENDLAIEYIPVEEQVSRYIDSLPLPKTEIKEIEEKQQIQEEKKKRDIENNTTDISDVELLARLMYCEEGVLINILPYEEAKRAHMLAGSVVINRTNMNYKGAKSIRETIYADGQYADTTLERMNNPAPDYVVEWAQELLEKGPIGPADMIYQAEFEQGVVYEEIYNQKFCCISDSK